MADTGAPWNIPYAEPTDLVRDWPALSEDVADAVAAGLTAAGNPGIGSNVVQGIKTDTFSTTTTGWQTITGLSATITPTTNTSKVLIVVQANITHSETSGAYAPIRVTGGNAGTYVGASAGSRIAAASMFGLSDLPSGAVLFFGPQVVNYVDAPGTTSPTTYQVEVYRRAGTVYLNRNQTDTNDTSYQRGASSIILIEVAP